MRHVLEKIALRKKKGEGFECGQNSEPVLYPRASEAKWAKAGKVPVRVRVVIETVDCEEEPAPMCAVQGCPQLAWSSSPAGISYCKAHLEQAETMTAPYGKATKIRPAEEEENLTHESRRRRR